MIYSSDRRLAAALEQLPPSERRQVMETARYHALSTLKLSGLSVAYTAACCVLTMTIAVAGLMLFGFPSIGAIAMFGIGLCIGLWIRHKLYYGLIYQGLQYCQQQSAQDTTAQVR